jgi:hypothetical protein
LSTLPTDIDTVYYLARVQPLGLLRAELLPGIPSMHQHAVGVIVTARKGSHWLITRADFPVLEVPMPVYAFRAVQVRG